MSGCPFAGVCSALTVVRCKSQRATASLDANCYLRHDVRGMLLCCRLRVHHDTSGHAVRVLGPPAVGGSAGRHPAPHRHSPPRRHPLPVGRADPQVRFCPCSCLWLSLNLRVWSSAGPPWLAPALWRCTCSQIRAASTCETQVYIPSISFCYPHPAQRSVQSPISSPVTLVRCRRAEKE